MITGTARITREGPQLLDRAEADPVRLSQGSIDRPRFGNAQLSPVDHEGNIGGISVTVTDETFRTGGLVDCCFEDPATSSRVTEVAHLLDLNAITAAACRQAQKTGVGDVPSPVKKKEIAEGDRKSV